MTRATVGAETETETDPVADRSTAPTGGRPAPRGPVRSWFAAGLAVAGAGYAVLALDYGFGTLASPGPGYLPVIVGVLTAVVGAVVAVTDPGDVAVADQVSGPELGVPASRFGPVLTLAIAAGTCVFMIWQSRIVGLLPAVGIGTAVIAWTMRTRPLPAALCGLAFTLVAVLVFQEWLRVPLPRGYF